MYVLDFKSEDGLNEPQFATFRLGGSWAKKIKPGDRVGIVLKGQQLIAECEVTRAEVMPQAQALGTYAPLSHLELQMRKDQGAAYDQAGAKQRRFESIQKLYGPHKFGETSKLTVIALKRIVK